MDDQQTYLLNGLVTRQFGLGRILRFRQVDRGRQAATFEILTAQQNEYLLLLFPPAFNRESLEFVAGSVNRIDAERFSVVPYIRKKELGFVGEGPQGSHLMVSLSPVGVALPALQFSLHDISQVGLRVAWMHRLLAEQLGEVPHTPLAPALSSLLNTSTPEQARRLPQLPQPARDELLRLLETDAAQLPSAWTHGNIQPAALLHDGDHILRTVVDWGLLHDGSPLEDLVDAFLTLCDEPGLESNAFDTQGCGRALFESYDSISPLRGINWVAVVANWSARRLLDAGRGLRPLPKRFATTLANLTTPAGLPARLKKLL